MRAFMLALACAVTACGGSESGDDTQTGEPGLFDACGGKIVASDGTVSAAEYKRQAALWDRATIDCRLGPGYDHYHPGDADAARPTATPVTLIPSGGGTLCPTAYTHDTPGPATYGSTSGQVAYAPDDPADPGLDRLQTSGWEGPGMCFQLQQGTWLGSTHPDQGVKDWLSRGLTVGVPIAKARTDHSETGDGIVIFSNGLVASTGTQTSGSSHPSLQLPPNKVPMAVAISNYNEFAVVAVWDTDAIKGQLAVIALRAPEPPAFSVNLFAAPNEGGFHGMQLLGYVDLPDMVAPTAIAFAGNNQGHNGPWVQQGSHAYQGPGSIFRDTSYQAMLANDANWVWKTDPTTEPGFFATAGGAVVASQWENKVTFVDFTPLFQFVRKVYVDPIKNADNEALYTMATNTTTWPFDFTTNPEMTPTVVTTIPVTAPRIVRYGIHTAGREGLRGKLLAWVGTLDGRIAAYDVTSLSGKEGTAGIPITEVGAVQVDPNPTSIHLLNTNDAFSIASRGNRSVQWVATSDTEITVVETLRDSRLDDPVAIDKNQRMPVITVGDFASGKVFNFERLEESCTPSGSGRSCAYRLDGELAVPGAVYFVDSANVN